MTPAQTAIKLTFNVKGAKMRAQLADISNLVVSRDPFIVTRVVDGDTIAGEIKTKITLELPTMGEIRVDLWLPVVVRLRHVNAPEKNTDDGQRALYFVGKWLEEHEDSLELKYTGAREKYGRLLGVIYADDLTLHQALLDEGLATPYEGGKR